MAFVDVKNKKGTAHKNPPPGYTSWLDFWEKKKGKKATQSEVTLCKGSPDIGGHVIKVGEGSKEYILPMSDCVILPITATTSEYLAEHIARSLDLPEGLSVEVCVQENVGSQGCYRIPST